MYNFKGATLRTNKKDIMSLILRLMSKVKSSARVEVLVVEPAVVFLRLRPPLPLLVVDLVALFDEVLLMLTAAESDAEAELRTLMILGCARRLLRTN